MTVYVYFVAGVLQLAPLPDETDSDTQESVHLCSPDYSKFSPDYQNNNNS